MEILHHIEGRRSRSGSTLSTSSRTSDTAEGDIGHTDDIPILVVSGTENWEIDTSSSSDHRGSVNWEKMPEMDRSSSPSKEVLSEDKKELKVMAREGTWSNSHSQRASAYSHIIKNISCRSVTPDAEVYKNIASKLFGECSVSTHPLPEFIEGCPMPNYCLSAEGITSVKKILICIGNQFPDITYCPVLPSIVALLLHFCENEAECFEYICRIIGSNDSKTHYIDQTFLVYEASCMTFGDLVSKHCQTVHKLIVNTSPSILKVYSKWVTWMFGDLPFEYAIRVLDVFLAEGQKVLYRVGLALLKHYKRYVASREPEIIDVQQDIQNFMNSIGEHVTIDRLFEKAFRIRLFSRKEIQLLQQANINALTQKGITVRQRRQSVHIAVDIMNFTSNIVTAQEMRMVWSWIPERFALFQPAQLFSTMENGYSLQRFYSACEGHAPTVLLLKTTEGEVCGAFLSTDWQERRKMDGAGSNFFGTGECFVFSLRPEMERFVWVLVKNPQLMKSDNLMPSSGSPSPALSQASYLAIPGTESFGQSPSFLSLKNFQLSSKSASMFMSGNNDAIIIGGGGGQALYIDGDLNKGRTEHCDTFDNRPLCKENFQIQHLEVWGIQDSSLK